MRQLVELRREPHITPLRFLRRADHDALDWVLTTAGVTELAARRVDTLRR